MAAYKEGPKCLSSKRRLWRCIISAAHSDRRQGCQAEELPASSRRADSVSAHESRDRRREEGTAHRPIGRAYRRAACLPRLSGSTVGRCLRSALPAWARISLWNDRNSAARFAPAESKVQVLPPPSRVTAQPPRYRSSQGARWISACRLNDCGAWMFLAEISACDNGSGRNVPSVASAVARSDRCRHGVLPS